MIVINLCGSPGAGKSTGAAYIFSKLKMAGINCELVTEYAKDVTWEKNYVTLEDQLYMLANQHHRLYRLRNQVDLVITDSPIFLSLLYNHSKDVLDDSFDKLITNLYNQYDNLNYFINRVKPYNPIGRNQTEKESDELKSKLENILNTYNIPYTEIDGDITNYDKVYTDIINYLHEREVKNLLND